MFFFINNLIYQVLIHFVLYLDINLIHTEKLLDLQKLNFLN